MKVWLAWMFLVSLPAWGTTNETPINLGSWLNQVAKATQQLNYDGTFVYQYEDTVDISHIAHRMDHAGELAKLDALSGIPHTYLRVNDAIYCYIPNGNQVRIERHQQHQFFPELLPIPATPLTNLYVLKALGHAQIAGHDSFGVSLTPRDGYRYGYLLWADEETHVLLKLVKLDEHEQPAGQFAFTQIDIGAALKRDQFQNNFPDKKQINIPSRESPTATPWNVSALPPGFHKITETQLELPNKPHNVIHIVYTDGLATISLFIEPLTQLGSHPPRGLSSQGVMNLYATTVGDYQVTALGEVPAATLLMIADSLNLLEPTK